MAEKPTAALREITFGSMAGMAAKLFEHPFDLVKVRLQSQPTDRPPQFNGPLDCFKHTFNKEGWRGLYRGLSSPIVGAALENATLFLVYKQCQDAIVAFDSGASPKALGKRREMSLNELAVAAAGAGAATSFVLTPIELVKCRMQVQMLARESVLSGSATAEAAAATAGGSAALKGVHAKNLPKLQGPFEIVGDIFKSQGIRGLWLGQLGTLLRETGGGIAFFTAYEAVARAFLRRRQATITDGRIVTKADLAAWQLMVAGAAAGVSYNFILFPADCIKSAIQTSAELDPHGPKLGFLQMGKKIYTTRGLRGLYAGCGLTCLKSAPSCALVFVLYENLTHRFGYLFD